MFLGSFAGIHVFGSGIAFTALGAINLLAGQLSSCTNWGERLLAVVGFAELLTAILLSAGFILIYGVDAVPMSVFICVIGAAIFLASTWGRAGQNKGSTDRVRERENGSGAVNGSKE